MPPISRKIAIFIALLIIMIGAKPLTAAEIVAQSHSGLPVIILKADDLVNYRVSNRAGQKENWVRLVDYLKSTGVLKVNIGAVGSEFRGASDVADAFRKDVKGSLLDSGVVEIFNHSDCFCQDAFSSSASYNKQYLNLDTAQIAVKSALGFTPIAFGSAGNRKTSDTVEVMNNHPEMKVWFYGAASLKGVTLDKTKVLNLERMPNTSIDSIASPAVFVKNFEALKSKPYVVFQGHPGNWSNTQFTMFKKSFDALLAKYPNVKSMKVSEYYSYSKEGKIIASHSPLPPSNIYAVTD